MSIQDIDVCDPNTRLSMPYELYTKFYDQEPPDVFAQDACTMQCNPIIVFYNNDNSCIEITLDFMECYGGRLPPVTAVEIGKCKTLQAGGKDDVNVTSVKKNVNNISVNIVNVANEEPNRLKDLVNDVTKETEKREDFLRLWEKNPTFSEYVDIFNLHKETLNIEKLRQLIKNVSEFFSLIERKTKDKKKLAENSDGRRAMSEITFVIDEFIKWWVLLAYPEIFPREKTGNYMEIIREETRKFIEILTPSLINFERNLSILKNQEDLWTDLNSQANITFFSDILNNFKLSSKVVIFLCILRRFLLNIFLPDANPSSSWRDIYTWLLNSFSHNDYMTRSIIDVLGPGSLFDTGKMAVWENYSKFRALTGISDYMSEYISKIPGLDIDPNQLQDAIRMILMFTLNQFSTRDILLVSLGLFKIKYLAKKTFQSVLNRLNSVFGNTDNRSVVRTLGTISTYPQTDVLSCMHHLREAVTKSAEAEPDRVVASSSSVSNTKRVSKRKASPSPINTNDAKRKKSKKSKKSK
jgi:hypothetical protein